MDTAAQDYYHLLSVDARAEEEALRSAWRRLAWRWHPDRAGPGAADTFRAISIAYAILSDPEARAAYDRSRLRREGGEVCAVPRRAAPGVRLSRLSAPLGALLARGVARFAEDGLIELLLEAQEAAAGGMITIAMRVPVRCIACAAGQAETCARCRGAGTIEDLFSAWLAVRPDVADGTILTPSAWLPGMLRAVYFRVRLL